MVKYIFGLGIVSLVAVALISKPVETKDYNVAADSTHVDSTSDTVNVSYDPSHGRAPGQVIYGNYCCDAWDIRRCVLVQPFPVGAGCFCYGQGAGWVCL